MAEKYEAVIGLEIHVQLATKSKMFCRCDNNSDGALPNKHTCPVCLGMPGTLPVPNRTAVEWALKTAMALGCKIPAVSKFDRKQYYYPDLPKGYQISQYDEPLGGPGTFEFDVVGDDGQPEAKTVRITRLHLEEDAGKLTHPKGKPYSLVDLNRAGTPLMEIVTEPDFRSPAEAKVFLQELRKLARYLGVSDADMEKGHLRADANVSVRPVGQQELGTKTELKNLNSFRFVERGLASEIARQTEVLEKGGTITQETRGYSDATGRTVSQRSKEESSDYRYFPEPDIPPLEPTQLGLDAIKNNMAICEGDTQMFPVDWQRKWHKYQLNQGDVDHIVERPLSAFGFDQALQKVDGKAVVIGSRWNDIFNLPALSKLISEKENVKIVARFAVEIDQLLKKKRIKPSASEVNDWAVEYLKNGSLPEKVTLVEEVDESDLEKIADEAIAANDKAVADFKGGNENSLNVLVGFVMKQTKGSANPTTVADLLRKKLG